MKTSPAARFDINALKDIAGNKVFARGLAYQSDGQVEILAIDSQRVLAQVAGTDVYRTEVEGRGAARKTRFNRKPNFMKLLG